MTKLDTLLKVHRQKEKEVQKELAQMHKELERLSLEENRLAEELTEILEAMQGICKRASHVAYASLLQGRLQKIREEHEKHKKIFSSQQKRVEEAMQKRKVLEKLREKRYFHSLAQKRRKENRFFDEIVRFQRE